MDEKKKPSVDNNNELEVSEKLKYPRSIAFIIGCEFCERFSYYGMRTILVLYFKNVLSYNEDSATEYFHLFAMACYFTPVLGAIIADSLLGKFRTIFYISILYAIGNVVLSFASYRVSYWISWVGLAAIALGTGGIKPCVAAFGGDQFGPGQEKQLQKFFSFFYISINAGSLLSTYITPILREDVNCFGRPDCFPLAFGVPSLLMIVALALFLLGKFLTNYKMIPPSKENIVVQVVCCVFTALGRKLFKRTAKRDHWLDYADDKYDAKTLHDIKAVMRVLFLYLPLPIFWALFDQQGSRWTLQATRMDGNLFGVYRLKPDQIQVVNPLLIIFMIPVFQYAVYPLLAKVNLLKKPLQRITTGGILAAVAFIICAFFQLKIESELPPDLSANSTHLTIVNGLPTNITIGHESLFANLKSEHLEENEIYKMDNVHWNRWSGNYYFTIELEKDIPHCGEKTKFNAKFNETFKDGIILFITESICSTDPFIEKYDFHNLLQKPEEGGANIGLVFKITNYDIHKVNGSFKFENEKFSYYVNPNDTQLRNEASVGFTSYKEIDVHKGGDYGLKFNNNATNEAKRIATDLSLQQGGSYLMLVYGDINGTLNHTKPFVMVTPNSVSMFWQIIQYVVITAGEIMFSITGLEFSYSQAPTSMKAVLQAAWLMTVAFGNIIVVIIASAKIFNKQSYEFFFFAGLMILDMMVFAIMAYFYVPYNGSHTEEDESDKQNLNGNTNKSNGLNNDKKGIANDGFSEDTKF